MSGAVDMVRSPDSSDERVPAEFLKDAHTWFGLTYASYLVVNRSLLQSMPDEWQHRFVTCLEELQHHFRNIDEPRYTVHARDAAGRFIKDPIPHYSRGRTFVPGADA